NWLGRRTPVHCTASGKAILAFGPDSVRERMLSRPLEQLTPHTITDRAELDARLAAAREAGAAHTHEELELGLDAIAAPVFGADRQVVAALDVSRPSRRLRPGSRPEPARPTKEGAADLPPRLGRRGRPREPCPPRRRPWRIAAAWTRW